MFPIDIKEFPPYSLPVDPIIPVHSMDSINENIPNFPCHIIPLSSRSRPVIKNWQESVDHKIEEKDKVGIICGRRSDIFALCIKGNTSALYINSDTVAIIDDGIHYLLFKYEPIFDSITNETKLIDSDTNIELPIKIITTGGYVPYSHEGRTTVFNNKHITKNEPQLMPRTLKKKILKNLNKPLIKNMPSIRDKILLLKPIRFESEDFVCIMCNITKIINSTSNEYYILCEEFCKLPLREMVFIWENNPNNNKSSFMALNKWIEEDSTERIEIVPGFSRGLAKLSNYDTRDNNHISEIRKFFKDHIFTIFTSSGNSFYITRDYCADPTKPLKDCPIKWNYLTDKQLRDQLSAIKIRNVVDGKKNLLSSLRILEGIRDKGNQLNRIKFIDLIDKTQLNNLSCKDGHLAHLFDEYKDPRIYVGIVFIPYSPISTCPTKSSTEYWFNKFNGFACKYNPDVEPDMQLLEPVLRNISNLCKKDSITNYFLDYFAHIVQYPQTRIKTNIAINTTNQNVKTFFDWFGREILGENYYSRLHNNSHKPANSFGADKLLIVSDSKIFNKIAHLSTDEVLEYDDKIQGETRSMNYSNHVIIGKIGKSNDYAYNSLNIDFTGEFDDFTKLNLTGNNLLNFLMKRTIADITKVPNTEILPSAKILITKLFDKLYLEGKFDEDLIISIDDFLIVANNFIIDSGSTEIIEDTRTLGKTISDLLGIKSKRISKGGIKTRWYTFTKQNVAPS